MMIVTSVYDVESKLFSRPLFAESEESAKRLFLHEVLNNVESILHFFPSHFDLFVLGTFDSSEGLTLEREPYRLLSGKDIPQEPRDV